MEEKEEEPYITTYSGKKVHFLTPDYDEVSLKDIAHHLSLLCRWTGATSHFYSVAEHSIMVATWVRKFGTTELFGGKIGVTDKSVLQALLHDAGEAYCNDLARPLKHTSQLSDYRLIERGMQQAVFARFGVEPVLYDVVAHADKVMQHTEAFHLLPHKPAWLEEDLVWKEAFYHGHRFKDPQLVEREFIELFIELQ